MCLSSYVYKFIYIASSLFTYQLLVHIFYLVIVVQHYPFSKSEEHKKNDTYYELKLYYVVIGLIAGGIITNIITTLCLLLLKKNLKLKES